MILKGRLELIAGKVPECNMICDIGTDHAYIPIYLVSSGICKNAIASDVKKGPIEAASRNIIQKGLGDRIEARLGYGLEPIGDTEADVIVIAGMGGILTKEILEKDIGKARNADRLVLQPMNAIEILRGWLYDNCFEIIDEELGAETEKIYNVLVVKWTGILKKDEEIYLYIGKKLIENRDPLLGKLLEKKIKQLDSAIKEMQNSSNGDLEKRISYIEISEKMKRISDSL